MVAEMCQEIIYNYTGIGGASVHERKDCTKMVIAWNLENYHGSGSSPKTLE